LSGPIYQRIRDALRERIANGEYSEGDRLPSESELIKEFGVARMTVRQALAQLVFENLIVRQAGIGSFVAAKQRIDAPMDSTSEQSFEELISAQGRTPALKLLKFEKIVATPEAALSLQIPQDSAVYCLERLRYVDQQLIGLEIRYLREDVGERVRASDLNTLPTFALVEAVLNEPIGTIDVSMFSAAASKELAAKLRIRRGAPILVREHVALDSAGRPILCGNSIYRGNLRFRYVYRRPRSPL
jgi:GntR family transcriptional regulator